MAEDTIFGIETCTFLDILPNPTVDMVDAATKVYKESEATSIVALGGGSPMDVAKAVGVLARYGGSITEYEACTFGAWADRANHSDSNYSRYRK